VKTARLIDVCEIISRGVSPVYTEAPDGIIVLNQRCIRNHKVSLGPSRKHDRTAKPVKSDKLLQDGDILINSTGQGTLGRTALFQDLVQETTVDSHITIVRPKKDTLYPKYLSYLMEMIEDDLVALATGTSGQTELPRTLLQELKITFVESLDEQKRIASTLEKAFEKIDASLILTEQNSHNSDLLFRSRLKEVFSGKYPSGWQLDKFADLCKEKPQYGLSIKMNEKQDGFKIFRMGEIFDGSLHDTGKMKYAAITTQEFRKFRLSPHDVLFNRTNSIELVGKSGIFDLKGDYCFASYLVRLRFDDKFIDPRFATYFMNSDAFLTSVRSKASKAVNQANFNATKLSNEILPHPISKSAQEKIVDELGQLWEQSRALLNLYQEKLRNLHKLKKSLLIVAFNGEV
jgi:type I restriction enzyme, S subunit